MTAAAKDKSKIWSKIIHGSIVGLLIATLSFSVLKYITEPQDRDRCHGMLNQGKWQNEDYKWEPSGCMPQVYGKKEMDACVGDSRIIYIGDSIMREQYYAMSRFLGHPTPTTDAIHNDQQAYIKAQNITIDMWWDPYLNTTRTINLLKGQVPQKEQHPTLVIMGCGVWYMRTTGTQYLSLWKTAMDRIFDGAINYNVADKLMLAPVEIVEHDTLNAVRQRLLTIDKITLMNNYLKEREANLGQTVTPLAIPFAWNEMVTTSKNQTLDGLHFKSPVTSAQAQLALNYRCNNDPSLKTVHYPYDTTCCYSYPSPAWYQTSLCVFIFAFVPLAVLVTFIVPSGHFVRSMFPSKLETQSALFVFGLGLVYMFIGDRSQLFAKMDKQFDTFTFTALCLFMTFLGAVTLKSDHGETNDAGFLNRDQTDEWKGWMQLAILIYHFVGASRIAGIYNPVRVLVAAYLFQTGYGHFFYFYKKADFGIARVLNIMVRLNLLTCVLTYLMKTDYLFYYFSPLCTFWFAVIWITMRILPSFNKKSWFVVLKMIIMSVITTCIIHVPGILETVFNVLEFLFKVKWDVVDWRFRLGLDAWIVYIGMLCALATIKCAEYKVSTEYTRTWNIARYTSLALSLAGFVGFFVFELTQTKASYTKYHPYISWIPILSFVVMRNFMRFERNTYSRFFAFVGKFSLETYIGQFHMWLAADTRGLLVIVPNATWVLKSTLGWYINLCLSTVVFFFVCYHLSHTTGTLTKWICSGAVEQQKQDQQQKTPAYDAVPLLPTTSPSSLLIEKGKNQQTAAGPAQLEIDSSDSESDLDLEETWQETPQPSLYQRVYHAVIDNYWVRSVVCLVLLGVFNRFC